jgi:hypothetical protein
MERADHLQQGGLCLHDDGPVPVLEEVPDPRMAAIAGAGVPG